MKKKLLAILAALAVLALAMTACSSGSDDDDDGDGPYTVTFDKNTTDEGSTAPVPATRTVTPPATTTTLPVTEPTRPDYYFTSYNTKSDGTGTEFTNQTKVTADITVYAQWKLGYKVTFDKNNEDATDPVPAFIDVDITTKGETKKIGADKMPTPPTSDFFAFQGWYTKKDFDPEDDPAQFIFDGNTEFTSSITVYAQWKFKGGAPKLEDGVLVHERPLLTLVDDTNGSTLNADGTVTLTKKEGGAVFSYAFPPEAYNADGTAKYDFFRFDFVASNSTTTYQNTQVHIRKYDKSTIKWGSTDNTGGRYASDCEYRPLSNNPKYFVFETSYMMVTVEGEQVGGFTLIDYENSAADGTCTVEITSVKFYTAPKFNVTFDWNYTGGAAVSPVNGIWGPLEGHPGYGVGAANWPATPDRTLESTPMYFLGWYDGLGTADEAQVSSGTIVTKNLALKAKWTSTEPDKVEKITTQTNSPVPVYQFKVPIGVKWADIKSVTYTVFVNDATTFAVGEGRQMVVGAFNENAFTGLNTDGTTGFYYNSAWGQLRMVFADASITAWLSSGKNAAGAAGGKDEWVTITRDVNPLAASYTGKDNSGNTVSQVTPVGASGTPDANLDLRTYYIGVGVGCRNANVASYYIKDVALVKEDGTKYPATDFADGKGYYGVGHPTVTKAPALETVTTTLLKDLAFGGGGTGGLKREMAYAPD